ncbi:hypothetical protein SRHO_G00132890 [Serrasalmus rhombeus]
MTVSVKKEMVTTEDALVTQFQERLAHYRQHLYNIRQMAIWNISAEIQSVHFGGSHQQATLHTGVLYIKAEQPIIPFCSISPSRQHDPPAIWAHLSPILTQLRERCPGVTRLHFFSDGPATQYKQKANFYMLSTEPFKMGFKETSWHFFEASHGKGAPDGIGDSLKRTADSLVHHGTDIPDAESLFLQLKQKTSSVELFFVSPEDVGKMAQRIVNGPPLVTIKGTMRMHQVISVVQESIKYRDISCVCKMMDGVLDCPCYGLQEFTFARSESQQEDHTIERSAPALLHPEVISKVHIGQWCIVNYDADPYPGIILEVEAHNIKGPRRDSAPDTWSSSSQIRELQKLRQKTVSEQRTNNAELQDSAQTKTVQIVFDNNNTNPVLVWDLEEEEEPKKE